MTLDTALARLYATTDWCEYLYPDATRTAVLEARTMAATVGTAGLQGTDPEGAARSIQEVSKRLDEALKQAALEAVGAKTVEDLLEHLGKDVVVLEPEPEEEHPPARREIAHEARGA